MPMTGSERAAIRVLRLGHRPGRDKRITTHIALTARALGAETVMLHRPDARIAETVAQVTERFGDGFTITAINSPHRRVEEWRGTVVHLTMYGTPLGEVAPLLRRQRKPLLLVVGAGKVPPWLYYAAHHNVAVGHQPHSEVAALALTLATLNPRWERAIPAGAMAVAPGEVRGTLATIPDADECLALHRRHDSDPAVVAHCCAVATLAAAVTVRLGGNGRLATAGGLLHDLGRARTHGLAHVAAGVEMLRDARIHPGVVHIVASHIGGGLTQIEARRAGLPPGDYLPRTLEARVVTACDNLHYGTARRPLDDCLSGLRVQGLEAGASRAARLHRWVSRRLGEELDDFTM